MARFLGVGCVFKSPRTTHTYTVAAAERWAQASQALRPPAHIIGVGGFGATYRVVDERGAAFAMKEFYPRDHAVRAPDGRITPKRDEEGFSRKIYEEGLRRFVAEGHLLTSFNHPNVLKVVDAFDDSGTSYQLMRLVEGREQLGESDTGAARIERRVTFEDFLRELEASGVPIDLPLIRPVIRQLLDAVEYIHTEGTRKAQEITGAATRALLHRDIKPSNILIEAPQALRDAGAEDILRHPDTKAILIDFGSARIFRDVQEDDVSRSIGVVTEGYAPPELKDNDIDSQGPHSDIYSIAAVIWRALMGRKPTTAQLANGAKIAELASPIVMPDGTTKPRASKQFLQAVDRALSAAVSQRPRSVAEWRAELSGQAAPARKEPKRQGTVQAAGGEKKRGGQAFWWAAMTAGFVAVSAYGFWQTLGGPERSIEREASAAAGDAEQAVKIAEETAIKADKASADAGAVVAQAEATARQGLENFTLYSSSPSQDVFHAGEQGDAALGDKFRNVALNDGSQAMWWCHKKGPGITPQTPYEKWTYKDFTIDGEPGWACGIPHTHHPYAGPRSPWRVTGDGYAYDGEVDAQQRPSGLGVMTLADNDTLEGRFTQDGTNYLVQGRHGGEGGFIGQFDLSLSPKPTATTGLAAMRLSKDLNLRAQIDGDRIIGILDMGETLTGVKWKSGFLGRDHKTDGTDVFAAGDKQSWGRIDRSDGVYLGQITDAQPDGCGVWKWRSGPKEVGFFKAGVKQPGELPQACKSPHYQRPVDLDAVARDGARALPS
jgi:serine/threonine protein kinase